MRFWYTKRVTLGNQRRFSLVELMLATAVLATVLLAGVVVIVLGELLSRAVMSP